MQQQKQVKTIITTYAEFAASELKKSGALKILLKTMKWTTENSNKGLVFEPETQGNMKEWKLEGYEKVVRKDREDNAGWGEVAVYARAQLASKVYYLRIQKLTRGSG